MFSKVLVANRGEIALRVIRTCKRLGVKTVAIYSDADKDALHVKLADQAFRVGTSSPMDSYLNLGKIMQIAEESGIEAIHPGYGFRSEHWDFAAACEEAGMIFVGPSSKTLSLTGNKAACRWLAKKAGIPVVLGTDDVITDPEEGIRIANEIGYPVLLKSAFGGGGRGIREARNNIELEENFRRSESETKGSFGRAGVYLEKIIRPARHIEFQILSDGKGKVIHLGERECSIQRRHQKLIELTPSPVVDEEVRRKIGNFAIAVARTVSYRNAGTVEFIRYENGNFYFIEVNSRLQVEHPVTEAVTGVDLVEEQLRIASGEGMGYFQDSVQPIGAAIECRINAEDPLADFAPSVGRVDRLMLPGGPGMRVDSALYQGCQVTEFYDSLIAKLVAWGRNLEEARKRMLSALEECQITGVKTTVPFHRLVLDSKSFVDWKLSTDFVTKNMIMETYMNKEGEESRRTIENGAAIAAAIMTQGFHKTITFQSDVARRRALPINNKGDERFFDAV